uniref:WAP domain-containing protein n=1 Tax=Otus sunia TaxID=257818 RepID=A0A8C8E544_9STRI
GEGPGALRSPARAKRGFCPRLDPDRVTMCLVECGSDRECRGSEKCCSMGCHVRCVQPVLGKGGWGGLAGLGGCSQGRPPL